MPTCFSWHCIAGRDLTCEHVASSLVCGNHWRCSGYSNLSPSLISPKHHPYMSKYHPYMSKCLPEGYIRYPHAWRNSTRPQLSLSFPFSLMCLLLLILENIMILPTERMGEQIPKLESVWLFFSVWWLMDLVCIEFCSLLALALILSLYLLFHKLCGNPHRSLLCLLPSDCSLPHSSPLQAEYFT